MLVKKPNGNGLRYANPRHREKKRTGETAWRIVGKMTVGNLIRRKGIRGKKRVVGGQEPQRQPGKPLLRKEGGVAAAGT